MTTAVKLPAAVGSVVKVTVSELADADVTLPTAPSLKATESLDVVAEKPMPAMVIVDALLARLVVFGVIEYRWIRDRGDLHMEVPLATPSTVTIAVKMPLAVGFVVKVTVSEVADALVTVPTAPLLKLTLSLAAVGSKAKPLIIREGADRNRMAVLEVTVCSW